MRIINAIGVILLMVIAADGGQPRVATNGRESSDDGEDVRAEEILEKVEQSESPVAEALRMLPELVDLAASSESQDISLGAWFWVRAAGGIRISQPEVVLHPVKEALECPDVLGTPREYRALETLRIFGEDGRFLAPLLVRRLEAGLSQPLWASGPYLSAYADAMGNIGPAPGFDEALLRAHRWSREHEAAVMLNASAARALGKLRVPEAVPMLLEDIQHDRWDIRAAGVEALGRIGHRDEDVEAAVLSMLSDPEPRVQKAAAIAAGRLRLDTPEVIEALLKLRQEPPVAGAWIEAREGLTMIGHRANDHLAKLATPQPGQMLGPMGREAAETLAQWPSGCRVLAEMAIDEKGRLDHQLTWAMQYAPSEYAHVFESVIATGLQKHPTVSLPSALRVIETFDFSSEETLEAVAKVVLTEKSEGGRSLKRVEGIRILRRLHEHYPDRVREVLEQAAYSEDLEVRDKATEALEELQ